MMLKELLWGLFTASVLQCFRDGDNSLKIVFGNSILRVFSSFSFFLFVVSEPSFVFTFRVLVSHVQTRSNEMRVVLVR